MRESSCEDGTQKEGGAMTTTKRNAHVWIVEMRGENGRWDSTVGVMLTRDEGRYELQRWRLHNPDDKFRLMKYSRKVVG